MSEWKEVRLGDVCNIFGRIGFRGYTINDLVSSKDEGAISLSPTNIIDGEINVDKCSYISWNKYYESPEIMIFKNDILIVKTGSSYGRTALVKEVKHQMTINPQFVVLKNININPIYLSYYIKSKTFQNQISSIVVGSAIPTLSQKNLANLYLKIQGSQTQQEIAGILSSLDAKIETNNKLNEKLEEMAQAIFKSWFVDFEPFKDKPFHETELGMIPEGWEVVSLDELTSKFGTGLNPRKNFVLGHGNNYYVTIKNMNNNRIYLDDKCDKVDDEALLKINARSKLKKGDLLFSGIGTIGRVAMVNEEPKNWNTSESVFNMHPSKLCTSEFLYVLLLSDVFQKFVKMNALGAVQQGIRMASLKSYTIAIPEKKVMLSFCSIIKPIVDYIQSNNEENDRLASLRDTLLPRLMSGELIV